MKSPLFHIIVWVSLCIVAFAGYGFWYATVSHKSVAVSKLQNQVDTKTKTADRIASARTVLSEVDNSEATIKSYFITETGVVSFINDLKEYARAQNTDITVLSVSSGKSGTQHILTFSLTVDGNFDAVMRTIGVIEYAPYNLSISKLSINKGEANDWGANIEIIVGQMPTP